MFFANCWQEYAVTSISRLNSGKLETKYIFLLAILYFYGTGRKCFITNNISYKAIQLILGRHSPIAPPRKYLHWQQSMSLFQPHSA